MIISSLGGYVYQLAQVNRSQIITKIQYIFDHKSYLVVSQRRTTIWCHNILELGKYIQIYCICALCFQQQMNSQVQQKQPSQL